MISKLNPHILHLIRKTFPRLGFALKREIIERILSSILVLVPSMMMKPPLSAFVTVWPNSLSS